MPQSKLASFTYHINVINYSFGSISDHPSTLHCGKQHLR